MEKGKPGHEEAEEMVRLGKEIQPQKADQIRLPPVQLLREAVLLETVTVEIVTVRTSGSSNSRNGNSEHPKEQQFRK